MIRFSVSGGATRAATGSRRARDAHARGAFDEEQTAHRAPAWIDRIASSLSNRNGATGECRLDRRRIYILPTRAGLLYATMMIAMLLAAINYQLALGYALTFTLMALGLVSMLHTWRNLASLVLKAGRADPVFAGEIAEAGIAVANPTRLARHALQFDLPGMAQPQTQDIGEKSENVVPLAMPTKRRGWEAMPRITVSTTFPLGLWRAWAYWQPAMRVLVYPQPENPAAPMPHGTSNEGETSLHATGEEDFASIRPYRPGDRLQRLAWKSMARLSTDELLTKEFDGSTGGELMFDWNQIPGHIDPETRLSRITRWVIDAESSGLRYGIVLPGARIDVDAGATHRLECLQALALHGLKR